MATDDDIRDQLVDLQSQLTFQEDTIHTLNNVVTEQQQQIERLNEMLNQLKLQVETAADSEPGQTLIEKPPHY